MERKYLFIVNKTAGSGRAGTTWPTLAEYLNQKNIDYLIYETNYPGHEYQLIQNLLKNNTVEGKTIVVVGGDGTLHQTLNGLHDAPQHEMIPLGYIPCGSGNDFARGAKIAKNPLKALKNLLQAKKVTTLDVGFYRNTLHPQADDGSFTNNIGIGFDATIVDLSNISRLKKFLNKYHLGSLVYVIILFKAYFVQPPFPVTITTENETHSFKRAFLVTTTNNPFFGGGVSIVPTASMTDGKLDLVLIEKLPAFPFLLLFILMLLPPHLHTKFSCVKQFRAEKLTISSPTKQHIQADGESLDAHPVELSLSIEKQDFIF